MANGSSIMCQGVSLFVTVLVMTELLFNPEYKKSRPQT